MAQPVHHPIDMVYGEFERKESLRKSNVGVLLSVLLFMIAIYILMPWAAESRSMEFALASIVVAFASAVSWFIGLSHFAVSKGYSTSYAFLGLFSVAGLVVLLILPDRRAPSKMSEPRMMVW